MENERPCVLTGSYCLRFFNKDAAEKEDAIAEQTFILANESNDPDQIDALVAKGKEHQAAAARCRGMLLQIPRCEGCTV